MSSSTAAPHRLTGRHVLSALMVFFGVMLAVNALFVYYALSTFGGLDTPDAYRKGLAYNATLAEAAAQGSLGWSARLTYAEDDRVLSLDMTSRSGRPVGGLAIGGRLTRPATDRFDHALRTFEERGSGHYELRLEAIAPGAWIADLEARDPASDNVSYRLRERLWLKPRS